MAMGLFTSTEPSSIFVSNFAGSNIAISLYNYFRARARLAEAGRFLAQKFRLSQNYENGPYIDKH